MAKKEEKKLDELGNVQHALTTSEAFIEKYQKQILTGVGVALIIVLSVLSFNNFYLQPREIRAENEMSKAQAAFATDSFKIALDGKGVQVMGFKEIASQYSFTKSGKLAIAYAGICYYKIGQFENAIKYLSQFSSDDKNFATTVLGLTGDCYIELGEKTKALSYFEKAADKENEVISPVYLKKAGFVYESLNQPEKAVIVYTKIKEKYPKSSEASDIEKYIARLQK